MKSIFAAASTWLALLAGAVTPAVGHAQATNLWPGAQVLKVDSHVQPASGVHEVSPIQLRTKSAALPLVPTRFVLGELVQTKADLRDPSEWGARQVGAQRPVAAAATAEALQQALNWQPAAHGAHVAALSVSAAGAHSLRLGLLVELMPGSARVRIYSQARPDVVFEISGQEIAQLIERNLQAGDTSDDARTWWSPEVGGDEATLEIEVPQGVDPLSLRVALPQVSHFYEDLSLPTEDELAFTTKLNESDPCNLDATCYDQFDSKRNAVARMIFTKNGSSYVCTGTLMADRGGTRTPYFLTANHCISTQTVASTLMTNWFYRSPSCNSRTLSNSQVRRDGGATLLYAATSGDVAFMRLNTAPPAGAVFSGWDASEQPAQTPVVGVHHPRGDLQKISFGALRGSATCTVAEGTNFSCMVGSSMGREYYNVGWSQGTLEGGSSGSGIFANGTHLIGTLYGGSSSCTAQGGANIYGRFDLQFQAGIKQWLSPAAVAPPAATARTAVYRFYNARTGAHFYTGSVGERDYVIATNPDFMYENVAFYAYPQSVASTSPVFRFYNWNTGAHFFTISAGERDYVKQTQPSYMDEGSAWFAKTQDDGTSTPMFRFYNTRTGAHFYTASAQERDWVMQTNPSFLYEGVAYQVWMTPQ